MATVTVLSRLGMMQEPTREGVVVISITDPNDPLDLPQWEVKGKVFRFEFDDVDIEEAMHIVIHDRGWDGKLVQRKPVLFTEEMAQQIMNILIDHPTHDIIVHCNAGVSRSVAVGRFISEESGRTLFLRGGSLTDETANGLVLRLLHRQLWARE